MRSTAVEYNIHVHVCVACMHKIIIKGYKRELSQDYYRKCNAVWMNQLSRDATEMCSRKVMHITNVVGECIST